jgi:putative NADH-flavin reductase
VIPESYIPIESLAGVLYHLQKEENELDRAFFSQAGNIMPGEK